MDTAPKITQHPDADNPEREREFYTLTVGNYKIEYGFGEWHLYDFQSSVPYIHEVRSHSRDTLLKIACNLIGIEQQADLIKQMFILAQEEMSS